MITKHLYLILFFLLLYSCSESKIENGMAQIDLTAKNISGTWLAIEVGSDDGTGIGEFQMLTEDQRFEYEFMDNFIVHYNSNPGFSCIGLFNINDSENNISFDLDCSNEENIKSTSKVLYLSRKELILSEKTADHGGKIKFIKE